MKRLFLLLLLVFAFNSCEDDCTQNAYCQLVSSQDYGKTVSTSKTGGDKIIICHKGNSIEISADDWADHESHGDVKGECQSLSATNLEFKDGEVVKIPCGYELPFVHVTSNGTQWFYSSPDNK